jgi:hypothetical protein
MKRLNREKALLAISTHGGLAMIALFIAAVYWSRVTIWDVFVGSVSASLATAMLIVVLAKVYKVKL